MLRKVAISTPNELYPLKSEKPIWFDTAILSSREHYTKCIERNHHTHEKQVGSEDNWTILAYYTPIEKRLDSHYFDACLSLLCTYSTGNGQDDLLKSFISMLTPDGSWPFDYNRYCYTYSKWYLDKSIEVDPAGYEEIIATSIDHYILLILMKSLVSDGDELRNDKQRIFLLNEVILQLSSQAQQCLIDAPINNKEKTRYTLIGNYRRSLLCNVLAMNIMSSRDEPNAVIQYARFALDAADLLKKWTYLSDLLLFIDQCNDRLVNLGNRATMQGTPKTNGKVFLDIDHQVESRETFFDKNAAIVRNVARLNNRIAHLPKEQTIKSNASANIADAATEEVTVSKDNAPLPVLSSSWEIFKPVEEAVVSKDNAPSAIVSKSPAKERSHLALLYQPSYLGREEKLTLSKNKIPDEKNIDRQQFYRSDYCHK